MFDIPTIVTEAKAHLDDVEAHDEGGYTFTTKKHEIDPTRLVVVAFVQDVKTKDVLQAATCVDC